LIYEQLLKGICSMTDANNPEIPQNPSDDRGDRISTGDIDGSVVAIGAGAKVIYKNVERALTKEALEVPIRN
jgi:hypothetical protein